MNQDPTNGEMLSAVLSAVQSTRGELLDAVQVTNQRIDLTKDELLGAITTNSQAILEVSHRQDLAERKTDQILVAINEFASHVEVRFQKIEGEIGSIKGEMRSMKENMANMATKDDLQKLKAQVVTKDYLDDKLADQRGDLIKFFRREIAASRG